MTDRSMAGPARRTAAHAWRNATSGIAIDRRLARAAVATLVVGGYMGLGFVFRLSVEAYLLLGIPITIAFQALIIRTPLRSLWLRHIPPMSFTRRSVVAIALVSLAPAAIAVGGVGDGDPVLAAYGLVGMAGAVGAVYAGRAMDAVAVRATIRATLITSAVLVATMTAYRLASGGFSGDPVAALATAALSVATYVPVVFVLEEVFFRGAIDTYLHGSDSGQDRAFAVYGSALWGLWHLPVMSVALGALAIPYLIAIHTALGYVLVTAWRRTGNLAAPGIAHAVSDALRNAVAVL